MMLNMSVSEKKQNAHSHAFEFAVFSQLPLQQVRSLLHRPSLASARGTRLGEPRWSWSSPGCSSGDQSCIVFSTPLGSSFVSVFPISLFCILSTSYKLFQDSEANFALSEKGDTKMTLLWDAVKMLKCWDGAVCLALPLFQRDSGS